MPKDEIQYDETPLGLDFSKMWSKEGREALTAAGEAAARFEGPAKAIKDLIDNPDLNQHQTEVAVAYLSGLSIGVNINPQATGGMTDFLKDLFNGRRD